MVIVRVYEYKIGLTYIFYGGYMLIISLKQYLI